jgi:hypothetical protein
MALAHERISVGTAATKISSDFAGKDGQTLLIQNPSASVVVYLGGEGVTTTSYGYALGGVTVSDMSIDLQNGETLFAVVASSTLTVNVLRQGV